jgi:hypothetical protein
VTNEETIRAEIARVDQDDWYPGAVQLPPEQKYYRMGLRFALAVLEGREPVPAKLLPPHKRLYFGSIMAPANDPTGDQLAERLGLDQDTVRRHLADMILDYGIGPVHYHDAGQWHVTKAAVTELERRIRRVT